MSSVIFEDLDTAGQALAGAIKARLPEAPVVLAIANGGVRVAIPIAQTLHAPLHAIVIRRLFVRENAELPVCAVSVAGNLMFDSDRVFRSEVEEQFVSNAVASLSSRVGHMTGGVPPVEIFGRHALLVDNGIHTAATIRIATAAVRRLQPSTISVAVPVGNSCFKDEVERIADQVVCLQWVDNFGHTGLWYKNLNRPNDDQVRTLFESLPGMI